MSESSYIKLSLPRLEVSNRNNPSDLETYLSYKLKLRAYAQKYGVWGIISGAEQEPIKPAGIRPSKREVAVLKAIVNDHPDDTDSAERLAAFEKTAREWVRYKSLREEFQRKKFDAQAALTESLSKSLTIQFLFNNKELNGDPAALWKAVQDWFMFNTPTILSHLVHEFSNIAMTEKESIDDFSVRLKTCLSYLNMLGHTESLSSQKEKFMTGVRSHPKNKYETLALITQSGSDYDRLDLDELIQKLSSSDVYVNKKPRVESAETKEQANRATVATTTTERRDQHGGRGQGRGRGRSQGRGRGAGRGAYRSGRGRPGQSYRGGGGGRGGQRDNRQEDRACYRCNKVGHLAKDCCVSMPAYDRSDERGRGRGGGGGGAPKRSRPSRDDGADYVRAYDDGDYVDHVNMSFETGAVINQRVMYVLDGGCSVSQTHIQSDLINITPHNRRVEVANGGILHTLARGSRGVVRHISYTPGRKRLLSEKALLKHEMALLRWTLSVPILCVVPPIS